MATVKFKDNTLTLLGNEVAVGQAAPDFKVQKSADMSDYTLASAAGKTRIIATVPSLDTPVCDLEAKTFQRRGEQAAQRGDRRRQHGPALRAEALVRRGERRQSRHCERSPRSVVRQELRPADFRRTVGSSPRARGIRHRPR